jgi:hypothetical protein
MEDQEMKRRTFRPELEWLNDRILLSVTPLPSTMPLPAEPSGGHGHAEQRFADYGMAAHGNVHGLIGPAVAGTHTARAENSDASPLLPTEAPSQATIDFTPSSNGTFSGGKLIIHLVAKDGTKYDQTFNIANGTEFTVWFDMVTQNLQQAGWNFKISGKAIIINGHNTASGGVSGPSEIKVRIPDYAEGKQPAISTTDGVKVGQKVGVSTPWIVSFAPIDSTNPTMTENATFSLTVDGTVVNVSLTSGMTVSQAAQALYNAMVSAGFSNMTMTSDGSGVEFQNNASGAFAINVSESWTDGTNPSPGGLSAMIDIANAEVS